MHDLIDSFMQDLIDSLIVNLIARHRSNIAASLIFILVNARVKRSRLKITLGEQQLKLTTKPNVYEILSF